MFGGYRLLLSLMVVWYHLVDWRFSGPVAVFGFYVVSGYLMTKVINEVYSDGVGGFNRYIANRALRIYPTYWLAAGLSAAILALLPEVAGQISVNYRIPDQLAADLTILGHRAYTPSLMPQAWSLAVELVYYIAMGTLLSRRPLITAIWFVAGFELVLAAAIMGGYPFRWFFTSLIASSLPFATGAMIYHFGGRLPRVSHKVAWLAVISLVVVGIFMPRDFGKAGGIYVGLVLAAIAVAGLARLPKSRLDDALGDLAYPIFLFHYPVGAVAQWVIGEKGLLTGGAASAATLLISWAAIAVVDRPLQGLRSTLRQRRLARAPKPAA